MTDAETFLNALAAGMPNTERLILAGFPGDPNDGSNPWKWKPYPWMPGKALPFGPKWNGYVAVSSFGRAPDTSFRRKKETFAAGRALMIDDVGELGPNSTARVAANSINLWPSAIIETSPRNMQYWYLLKEPERDPVRFDGLIRAFIDDKLLGKDPGMVNITRVARLPGFKNGKAKYGGFTTRLVELNGRRFTVDQLVRAFGLRIKKPKPPKRLKRGETGPRIDVFRNVEDWLRGHDMLKRAHANLGGWQEMTCPWVDEHTDRADNGAALGQPSRDNGFTGAFRCHHSACSGRKRGWRHLTDWIDKMSVESINETAANPEEFERRYFKNRLPPASSAAKLARSKKRSRPVARPDGLK
jgi:hypothetical protein